MNILIYTPENQGPCETRDTTEPTAQQPSNPTVAKNSVDNLKVPEKDQNFELNAAYKHW